MSLRMLKKQCGVSETEASAESRTVTEPQGRSGGGRGGGGGYYSSGPSGGGGGERRGSGPSRGSAPSGTGGVATGGFNVAYPAPSGGFRGSSAQAAHVEAMRKATAESRSTDSAPGSSDVALKSGLGLEAVRERKRQEEEERQAKRDAARAKRRNEATKKEADDEAALAECEEQARQDAEESGGRVKYEAALVVRIAVRFGSAGVWVKISEARARGANIPLDPKRIYVLAHPDKCALPEASDATAILNAQRPPEMTEVRAKPPREATPPAAPGATETAPPQEPPAEGEDAPDVTASAAAPPVPDDGKERRTDPEDGKLCTLEELHEKYADTYSTAEIEDYWKDFCKPKPKTRRF